MTRYEQTVNVQYELLAYLFLREIGAILTSRDTYQEAQDALTDYLAEVRLYARRSDLSTKERFPNKGILTRLIEPHTLNDSFRGWLRKQGIDPDRLQADTQSVRNRK